MLTYGSTSFSYSDAGTLKSKIVGTDTTKYTYDAFGNLVRVILPAADTIDYVIDGQNRRVGVKVNGTLQKGFLYQNQLKPVAELDGSGALVSRFVYGARFNVPEYMVRGGTTYRLISDHLGSVRLVVDTATGTVAQQLNYDEWGNVTLNTSPGFQPFGFAGGLVDDSTTFVRFGYRDYDPAIGRWAAKDPTGFGGGSANLFAYVAGDPINWVDPLGLDPEDPRRLRDAADIAAGFVPGVSTGVDAVIAATGYNPITGQCVGLFDRGLAALGFIIPGISGGQLRLLKRGVRSAFRGGENAAAALGRRVHKEFYKGTGLDPFTLPSGLRADAVDWTNRIVHELKPSTQRAGRGLKQLQDYVDEFNQEFGHLGEWTGQLDRYDPSNWLQ